MSSPIWKKAEGQRIELKRVNMLRKGDELRAKVVLRAARRSLQECAMERNRLARQLDELESMVRSIKDCRGLTLDQILTLHATCVDAVNPYCQTDP